MQFRSHPQVFPCVISKSILHVLKRRTYPRTHSLPCGANNFYLTRPWNTNNDFTSPTTVATYPSNQAIPSVQCVCQPARMLHTLNQTMGFVGYLAPEANVPNHFHRLDSAPQSVKRAVWGLVSKQVLIISLCLQTGSYNKCIATFLCK